MVWTTRDWWGIRGLWISPAPNPAAATGREEQGDSGKLLTKDNVQVVKNERVGGTGPGMRTRGEERFHRAREGPADMGLWGGGAAITEVVDEVKDKAAEAMDEAVDCKGWAGAVCGLASEGSSTILGLAGEVTARSLSAFRLLLQCGTR